MSNPVCERVWKDHRLETHPQNDTARVVFAELAGEIEGLERALAAAKEESKK